MKKNILLIGGGGHCRSVIDVIEAENKFKIYGIIDIKENVGNNIFSYNIIGTDEDLFDLRKKIQYAFVTIGHIYDNSKRVRIFEKLKELDYFMPIIISPFAYVSRYAKIQEGTIVMHHAMVNANAQIGKNCIINSKALIEHDAIIEDNVHIATGAIINGGVKVLSNSFIGSNTTTKQNIIVEGFNKAGRIIK